MSHAPLKVEVRRSGGFAGRVTEHTADAEALDQPAAEELRRLVAALEVADPPADARSRGADRFQYDVTVQQGAGRRRFSADDGALAPELRALVQFVRSTSQD